jgi:nucleoside-diphosphate-sugar epimerase
LLARGHVVDIYARSVDAKNSTDNSLHIPGDLTDRDQLLRATEGKDAVFHVAAKAGVWGRRRDYFDANVTGTRNVVAACGVHGVKTLVYTSTPSVVFGSAQMENANEDTPYATRFLTHYAETKCIAEKEVLAANGIGALRAVALRPHLIWGPGDPHLVPRVLARARAGKLKRVGDGSNKVDITHLDDAADAHILALEKIEAAAGKAYFISSETINLWQWIGELLKRAGLPALTRQVSRGAAYRVGALLELVYGLFGISKEPPMTRFVAENLATSHWFDISRARKDLGYSPKNFGVAALDDYLQTEKAHASH